MRCLARCCRWGNGGGAANGFDGAGAGGREASEDLEYRVRLRERGADVRILEGLDGETLSGCGAALAGTEIEQDAAYWEVRVTRLPEGASFCAGVARDCVRLGEHLAGAVQLEARTSGPAPEVLGAASDGGGAAEPAAAAAAPAAWVVSSVDAGLAEGDILGVAFGQASLPNLRFFRNGEALGGAGADHVRGAVRPAFSVRGGAALAVSFEQDAFQYAPPPGFTELTPMRSLL
mmetsp:Transcript_150729/g.420161  ORF Transcript_150729/g.420161 Transcript_150729/m.420161 type:complete len:233 (-) Transcript_150729:141-839(-)